MFVQITTHRQRGILWSRKGQQTYKSCSRVEETKDWLHVSVSSRCRRGNASDPEHLGSQVGVHWFTPEWTVNGTSRICTEYTGVEHIDCTVNIHISL